MRVYKISVWQWWPEGLEFLPEESESFNYEGPVLECKSAPDPPPAPDFAGAAQATASGNTQAAQLAQQANLVNQYTPYGSLTYSQDPTSRFTSGNPSYSSNVNLEPIAQKTLDTQFGLSNEMGNLAQGQIANVNQTYGTPIDLSSVNDIYNKSYGAQTSRLDPQWAQNTESQAARLANQGIQQGSQAYDNSMRQFNQAKNDAYQQAQLAAIGTMPQTYQLATAAYEQPLNQLNAIRTGAQIQNPQFGSTPQQTTMPGANYLGAAQAAGQYGLDIYGQQVGAANAFNQGLFGLGGAGLLAYGLRR